MNDKTRTRQNRTLNEIELAKEEPIGGQHFILAGICSSIGLSDFTAE